MNLRNRTMWIGGVSLVAAGGMSLGTGVANSVMSGDFSVLSAIKWSSIIAGVAILLYFLVSKGVLANENLEEGERGYRRRWGKIVTKRKTGKRKLLLPGKKHFYVKHMYDVVVQSVRVRSSPKKPDFTEPIRATYRGRNIWYLLIVRWSIEDTDEAIYKSLTQIYQVNRAREGDDSLESFVLNAIHVVVRRCLGEFAEDENGLPIISTDGERGPIPALLCETLSTLSMELGVKVHDISPALLTIAPEGAVKIEHG